MELSVKPLDPRRWVIRDRLNEALSRVAVISPKGGVGKTTITASIAIALSKAQRVGVVDLDFYNPTLHLALGLRELPPFKEEEGILPPQVRDNLHFISISHFTGDNPLALRGKEATDALLELLAIARWRGVNTLLFDTPPGMGEMFLNIFSLFPRDTHLIAVATYDLMSIESLKRLLKLLSSIPQDLRKDKLTVIINRVPDLKNIDEKALASQLGIDEERLYLLPELRGLTPQELSEELAKHLPAHLLEELRTS